MPEISKLYTTIELADLNAKLNLIEDNLNRHVNHSVTVAHEWNSWGGNYYDSGGDLIGNSIITFSFPDITLYVPVMTASPDPGPSAADDGVVYTAATPTGASLSPGVPLVQRALITQSPAQVALEQANIYNDILLYHSNCGYLDVREMQAHGGMTYTMQDTFDTLGHKVGRYLITMGYKGMALKLVADTSSSGPPLAPRINFQEPQTYFEGGSSEQPFHLNAPSPNLTVGYGAAPISFEWQMWNYGGSPPGWVTVGTVSPSLTEIGGTFYPGSYSWNPANCILWYARCGVVGGYPWTWFGSYTQYNRIQLRCDKNAHWPFVMRCRVFNAAGQTFSKIWYAGTNDYNGDSGP